MLNRTIDPKELAKLEKEEHPFSYDPTLEEWLLYWLDTFIFPVCRPSTCMNFRSYITAHICPLLGDYHLMELRPVMLQYFVRHQLEQGRLDHSGGLARKTVMEQFNVLSRALRKAVAMGYLEYDPSQAVELPEKEQHEQRTLTIQEQQRVSQAVDPTWQTSSLLPVLLGEYAGLRIGEIAGLQIGDIDLKRRRIHVQRSLNRTLPQDVDGTCRSCLHYGRTKNGRTRYVPMSDDLYNALSVYMDTMPADMRKEEAPLFITSRGNPMEPKMIRYHFNRLMKRLSIEDIHFHSLRHTFATRAMEAQMNLKVCSQILGHSSTRITADIYTHVSEFQMRKEIKKLNMEQLQQLYT